MALLDIFKKREKEEEKEKKGKPVSAPPSPKRLRLWRPSKATVDKEEKKVEKVKSKLKKLSEERKEISPSLSSMILKAAHVTEKAGDLAEKNQYIFKVYPEANKIKIKKAIQDIFKVDVTSVKIINVPKKKRRLGKISGWRRGYKKAIVGIKKDQKIDILPR